MFDVTQAELIELPSELEALKALVLAQCVAVAELEQQLSAQRDRLAVQQRTIEQLQQMLFGRRSEKCSRDGIEELPLFKGHLFLADILAEAEAVAQRTGSHGEIEMTPAATPQAHERKKKGGRRSKYPPSAPVVTTRYRVADGVRTCSCGVECKTIGWETRRELERIEVTVVHQIEQEKIACPKGCPGVITAEGPQRVIEKGILGHGFLAHLLVERFGNHMPYNRLEKKYASEGLDLSRSVLQRSAAKCAELLDPIWQQVRRDVMSSPVIFTDDTPVTLIETSTGAPRKGRTWIYLDRDGRHFYDFSESRSQEAPLEVLSGYEGFVHADAYPGYDCLYLPQGATEVACWAHARRKFWDLRSRYKRCAEILGMIGELYGVERGAAARIDELRQQRAGTESPLLRDEEDEIRRQVRQDHCPPILARINAWLELCVATELPNGELAAAAQYSLNHWTALCRYASDGRLSIDNNAAERALRAVAVGRKNWLFYQTAGGGKTAAILLSLVKTARAIGIDPRTYLRDVLVRIQHCREVTKLTPHGWKAYFADEVEARRKDTLARFVGPAP
jgi:transposase